MNQNEEDDFNVNNNMKHNIKSARVPKQQLSSESDQEIPKEMSIVGVSGRFIKNKGQTLNTERLSTKGQ